ncbi:hypothetical protein NMY22_g1376 [Coprinellus aureogranulatus]|nr:hypothetical protein NMY22_g1376 [Coprinellus aureogranulatus]
MSDELLVPFRAARISDEQAQARRHLHNRYEEPRKPDKAKTSVSARHREKSRDRGEKEGRRWSPGEDSSPKKDSKTPSAASPRPSNRLLKRSLNASSLVFTPAKGSKGVWTRLALAVKVRTRRREREGKSAQETAEASLLRASGELGERLRDREKGVLPVSTHFSWSLVRRSASAVFAFGQSKVFSMKLGKKEGSKIHVLETELGTSWYNVSASSAIPTSQAWSARSCAVVVGSPAIASFALASLLVLLPVSMCFSLQGQELLTDRRPEFTANRMLNREDRGVRNTSGDPEPSQIRPRLPNAFALEPRWACRRLEEPAIPAYEMAHPTYESRIPHASHSLCRRSGSGALHFVSPIRTGVTVHISSLCERSRVADQVQSLSRYLSGFHNAFVSTAIRLALFLDA